MAITPIEGPIGVIPANAYGAQGYGGANQNPQEGPSFFFKGYGLLDPRSMYTYIGGQSVSHQAYMWPGVDVLTCDAVPSAAAANNIAASQSPAAGAITLVSSSGAGVTVGASVVRADTQVLVTGLLALDTAMAPVPFGQDGTLNLWDPTKIISRTLRFVSGGNDSGITFTVTGFDVYGFPMSETITGGNIATANGNKAWKYIQTITHTGSVAGTLTIGTNDFFGFPMRSDRFSDLYIMWNNAWITANTGYLPAVTTNPATTTTGDVRGTYNVQSASDGTKRLTIYQSPIVANMLTVNGLFGVPQNLTTAGQSGG